MTFCAIIELLAYNVETQLSTKGFSPISIRNTEDKINLIYNKMLNEFTSDISIESLAGEFHFSKSGFCSYFKRRTSETYSDFVNELRVGNACKLLVETDMPIIEVCYDSGFKNLFYFNRRFKEIIGRSPKDYKKEVGVNIVSE